MTESREKVRYVFVVGCPRSGTTWLQLLLWQHPEISSSMETHLFKYLAPMVATWNHYRNDRVGLQSVLLDNEFDELLKIITVHALNKIGSRGVVIEKTPDHVFFADLILRVIPDSSFLHVIRDPRAVTSSLVSAAASWGSRWATTNVAKNATWWVNAVSAGVEIGMKTTRYLEIRYEDIQTEGVPQLERIFDWLGLDSDPGFCRRAIEACTIDRLRAKAVEAPWPLDIQPSEFYRRGEIDAWCQELSRSDIRTIEYLAGDLMKRFGYEPTTDQKKPLSLRLADFEGLLARRCAALGKRWCHWIESRGGCIPAPYSRYSQLAPDGCKVDLGYTSFEKNWRL